MSATEQLCTFHLDRFYFGVNVEHVQEVVRYHEMTRVPLAHRVVCGLINLRGQIVTAMDLRRRLGLPERKNGELPMNVVIRSDDSVISLMVDEIGDVLDVDTTTFERPPETLDGIGRELIRGVYKLPDRLMLILDTEKVVSLETAAEGKP